MSADDRIKDTARQCKVLRNHVKIFLKNNSFLLDMTQAEKATVESMLALLDRHESQLLEIVAANKEP